MLKLNLKYVVKSKFLIITLLLYFVGIILWCISNVFLFSVGSFPNTIMYTAIFIYCAIFLVIFIAYFFDALFFKQIDTFLKIEKEHNVSFFKSYFTRILIINIFNFSTILLTYLFFSISILNYLHSFNGLQIFWSLGSCILSLFLFEIFALACFSMAVLFKNGSLRISLPSIFLVIASSFSLISPFINRNSTNLYNLKYYIYDGLKYKKENQLKELLKNKTTFALIKKDYKQLFGDKGMLLNNDNELIPSSNESIGSNKIFSLGLLDDLLITNHNNIFYNLDKYIDLFTKKNYSNSKEKDFKFIFSDLLKSIYLTNNNITLNNLFHDILNDKNISLNKEAHEIFSFLADYSYNFETFNYFLSIYNTLDTWNLGSNKNYNWAAMGMKWFLFNTFRDLFTYHNLGDVPSYKLITNSYFANPLNFFAETQIGLNSNLMDFYEIQAGSIMPTLSDNIYNIITHKSNNIIITITNYYQEIDNNSSKELISLIPTVKKEKIASYEFYILIYIFVFISMQYYSYIAIKKKGF